MSGESKLNKGIPTSIAKAMGTLAGGVAGYHVGNIANNSIHEYTQNGLNTFSPSENSDSESLSIQEHTEISSNLDVSDALIDAAVLLPMIGLGALAGYRYGAKKPEDAVLTAYGTIIGINNLNCSSETADNTEYVDNMSSIFNAMSIGI